MAQMDEVLKIRSKDVKEVLTLTQQFSIFFGCQGRTSVLEDDQEEAAR